MQTTVQKRMAIAMAMKPYCSHYEIAEVLHRDRSVIYHYLTKHDDYIQYWDGYKQFYEMAKIAVVDVLADYDIKQKVSELEDQIERLLKARNKIKKKLEESTS
jgi:IS30 family transposase